MDTSIFYDKNNDKYTLDKNSLKIFEGEVKIESENVIFNTTYSPDYFGFRIVLTEKCNYGCKHCFVKDTKYNNLNDISEKNLYAVLEWASKYGVKQHIKIQFFGGEPLIKFNLIKQAVLFMQEKVKISEILQPTYAITVNGSLITGEIADFFKEYSFGVGVSLDGPKEVNDKLRVYLDGRGTYDATIKGIRILQSKGVNFWILITPLKDNYKNIPDYIKLFKKEFDIKTITINTPINSKMQLLLDGKEFAHMIMGCILVGKEVGIEVESCASAALYCLSHKIQRYSQCSIGDNKIMVSVSPNAEISFCAQTWDKFIGSKSVYDFEPFKLTTTFDSECSDCPAQYICGGPCTVHLKYMHEKDAELCKFYKTFLELFFYNIEKFINKGEEKIL